MNHLSDPGRLRPAGQGIAPLVAAAELVGSRRRRFRDMLEVQVILTWAYTHFGPCLRLQLVTLGVTWLLGLVAAIGGLLLLGIGWLSHRPLGTLTDHSVSGSSLRPTGRGLWIAGDSGVSGAGGDAPRRQSKPKSENLKVKTWEGYPCVDVP